MIIYEVRRRTGGVFTLWKIQFLNAGRYEKFLMQGTQEDCKRVKDELENANDARK